MEDGSDQEAEGEAEVIYVDEKIVRDVFTYLPHRVAAEDERIDFLFRKIHEEVREVMGASGDALIEELADLVEVCYAIGDREKVEAARSRSVSYAAASMTGS